MSSICPNGQEPSGIMVASRGHVSFGTYTGNWDTQLMSRIPLGVSTFMRGPPALPWKFIVSVECLAEEGKLRLLYFAYPRFSIN